MSISKNESLLIDNIRLEPMQIEHFEKLKNIGNDPEIWKHNPSIPSFSDDLFKVWFCKAMNDSKNNKRIAYTVFVDEACAGTTSFYSIKPKNSELSIGYSWFGKAFRGRGINTRVKNLLFETARKHSFNRVIFRVDSENQRSIRAIEKLNGKLVQTIENDLLKPNLQFRNTCILSVDL